ncbi:MAG: hypothetical protein HUK08_00585 [Bacteroidaceae bacterium]|nr:hypothetical protein [Bacteroidaceae bacterium]
MNDKKHPKWIEGVGWRYETEHRRKRRFPGHRYNDVGTYLITITVEGRLPVFGHIEGDIRAKAGTAGFPTTALSPLGESVLHDELPKIHATYPMAEVWNLCIMPDHLHIILRINSLLPKDKHLGSIVGAFKGGISRAWWRMNDRLTPDKRGLVSGIQGMMGKQGQRPPLFEDGYNDCILMRDGQLDNWMAYLADNPFRWLVRNKRPELMQRALCLVLDGVRYGAFGNFMLLRHPEKIQVFFHRRMMDDRLPPDTKGQGTGTGSAMVATEQTLFWKREHGRLMDVAEEGGVLVTPGISECEKRIKNECLERHLRLIHLQSEPIGKYWKPERMRFGACAAGTLLILAPWAEELGGDSRHERFHQLNNLAASICAIDHHCECKVNE